MVEAKFLRCRDVMLRYGLARSTIYDLVRRKEMPAPVKLGARASAWSVAELELWERSRQAKYTAKGVS